MTKHKHRWSPPETKYEMVVESVNITTNGLHEIRVHILETKPDGTTVKGASEDFGVDPVALKLVHGDDPEKWRAWVYGEMKDRYVRRAAVHAEIYRWKGKRFSPDNPDNPDNPDSSGK